MQDGQATQRPRYIADGQPAGPDLFGALDVDEVLVHGGGAKRRAGHHHPRNGAGVGQHGAVKQGLVELNEAGVVLEALK
jgi:hypothetical protein